jgi:hypothetical protein
MSMGYPSAFVAAVGVLALMLAPHRDAAASHGSTISGSGTAVVDGVLSPGEWDGAATLAFTANLPQAEGGGTVPARALVMNDARNLYLALRLERNTYGYGADVSWFFDNGNPERRENGDDALSAQVWRTTGLIFYDGYRWQCPGASPGTPAFCGSAHDDLQVQGSPPPGTIDGQAAVREGDGLVVFEIAHPLDSADDAHDFSLRPGSTIGYQVFARFVAPCTPDPGCWADATPPVGHIGISPGAELQLSARAAPARVRVGKTVAYTVSIGAEAGGAAADNVSLVAELPARVRVTSVRTTAGNCTGRDLVECRLGALAPGSIATVTIRARALRRGVARLVGYAQTTSYATSGGRREARATATIVRR